MSAGRVNPFARTTAGIAVTLTLGGLSVAIASPASAAPDTTTIGAAKSRAATLSHRADVADGRHHGVEKSLEKARKRLKGIDTSISTKRRLVDRLQTEVATMAVDGHTTSGGTSDPATPPVLDAPGSKTLLTGVAAVTEDTDGRTQEIASTTATITQLAQQRPAVQQQVARLAQREQSLQDSAQAADAAARSAASRVATLQAQAAEAARRAEARRVQAAGGPAVAYALAQVGKAYVWGASGPSAFDCSGLTMAAWAQAGVSLPHNSVAQYNSGRHISESELQPGDLVFYYSGISHVGMYIGNGQIVNALNPGTGVKISGLHDMPYVGAVRPG